MDIILNYNQIKIKDYSSKESIIKQMKYYLTWPNSSYIDLTKIEYNESINFLYLLKDIMIELNINPKIPLPIYIITQYNIPFDYFYFLSSVKKLPSYFNGKTFKQNRSNKHRIERISLEKNKIKFIDLNQKFHQMDKLKQESKKLKNLVSENIFFKDLIDKTREELS
jgi:hypothetical protein